MNIPNKYTVSLKDNHYRIKMWFTIGSGMDLKMVYTPEYFEELGFFTTVLVNSTSGMEGQSGGGVFF